MNKFSVGDSIGALPASDISAYLTEIGDHKGAMGFIEGAAGGQSIFSQKKPYTHTGFILGYVVPGGTECSSPVIGMGQTTGDSSLINTRIKITLDKFYVHNYPGAGTHSILCEFSGKNQVAGETEQLQFALRFKAGDKASASLSGVPLFLGVTVGNDGISFEGRTINVSSSLDETLLATLDSPAFKSGLSLLSTAQPALKPFSTLAEAAVKHTLTRKQNKQVHNFNLGLDFGDGATSARLRLGAYVVIQSDEAKAWDWDELEWNKDSMSLRYKASERDTEFNYMVIGVTKFTGN